MLEKAAARIQQPALRPYYKDHVQHMMDIAKQYEAAALGRNRAAYQGAALYETALSRTKLVTLRERGENGNTSVSLPEDWDPAKVHAYCFATSKNGRMASDSRHLAIS